MPFAFRSAAIFTLTSLLFVGLGVPACSQQGEGERCDKAKSGDADCEEGLVCVAKNDLLEDITDRCCDPDETNFNDTRCRRGSGGVTPGTGGTGAMSEGGADNQPSGGDGGAEPVAGNTSGGNPSGGTPSELPEGGTPSGGMPTMSDGGVPAGGTGTLPSAGQGGAD